MGGLSSFRNSIMNSVWNSIIAKTVTMKLSIASFLLILFTTTALAQQKQPAPPKPKNTSSKPYSAKHSAASQTSKKPRPPKVNIVKFKPPIIVKDTVRHK